MTMEDDRKDDENLHNQEKKSWKENVSVGLFFLEYYLRNNPFFETFGAGFLECASQKQPLKQEEAKPKSLVAMIFSHQNVKKQVMSIKRTISGAAK